MPENPLVEERSGDLREFGSAHSEGRVELDREGVAVVPEEEGTQPEEDLTPTHTPADAPTHTPVEASEEEGEEEDGDPYDAMLSRVREQHATPDSAASEEDDEKAVLKERLANLEGRLRTYDPQPAPAATPAPKPQVKEEEDAGIDYSDPAVAAALAKGLSDPKTLGSTLQAVVNLETERLVKRRIGDVQAQVQEIRDTTKEDTERSELSAQLAIGLQHAYNMGGLEAAIVREAEEKREGSMLYQYLAMNPELATSSNGVVTATLAVSRAVQKADEAQKDGQPEKKGPAPLATRRQTRASKRGQKLITPKAEGTKEDQSKAEILGAARPSQSVEFMK